MITLEQYAAIYLSMIAATGNPQQEQQICAENGITIPQWQEAHAYYTAKMSDPSDMGKTAMAFSAAMTSAKPLTPIPANFVANSINVYINEYDVQMVEFINKASNQHVVLQLGFEARDDFEKDYINGRVHISINDQSHSLYGGVSKVELSSKNIIFIFDEEGKNMMKCNSIEVAFEVNRKYYNYLKRKIRFMYKNILTIKEEETPNSYTVNSITLNDEWTTFKPANHDLIVTIRPHLQNIKETGKYKQVVFVDFMSSTIGKNTEELALLTEMENCLKDTLEYDLAAVITFSVTDQEKRRFFIYTYLNQNEFMTRINDAFKLLPKLPLAFSGGIDEAWDNYTNCLNDLNA